MGETNLAPVGPDDHVIGASDPKLTLIEHGDFGCQFCNAAKLPIESLLGRHPELRLVWRHLPDPELHAGADLAAELSELAARNGRFWEAHSLLLTGRREFSRDALMEIAEELELEPDEAVAAFEERTFRERVLADVAAGRRAGARGTPTFFLGGERLEGPWRELAQLVPAKLAQCWTETCQGSAGMSPTRTSGCRSDASTARSRSYGTCFARAGALDRLADALFV